MSRRKRVTAWRWIMGSIPSAWGGRKVYTTGRRSRTVSVGRRRNPKLKWRRR